MKSLLFPIGDKKSLEVVMSWPDECFARILAFCVFEWVEIGSFAFLVSRLSFGGRLGDDWVLGF